jgi:hypothetical protein
MPDEDEPSTPPPPQTPPPLDYARPHVDSSDSTENEPNAETWADLFRAMGLVVFLLLAFALMASVTCGGAACLVGR